MDKERIDQFTVWRRKWKRCGEIGTQIISPEEKKTGADKLNRKPSGEQGKGPVP